MKTHEKFLTELKEDLKNKHKGIVKNTMDMLVIGMRDQIEEILDRIDEFESELRENKK